MLTVRTHGCTVVARGPGGGDSPRKYGLNWTMPAIVNSIDGSFGTRLAAGSARRPRSTKNLVKVFRSWSAFPSCLTSLSRYVLVRAPPNLGRRAAPSSAPRAPSRHRVPKVRSNGARRVPRAGTQLRRTLAGHREDTRSPRRARVRRHRGSERLATPGVPPQEDAP